MEADFRCRTGLAILLAGIGGARCRRIGWALRGLGPAAGIAAWAFRTSSAAGVPGTSAGSNCKLKRAAVYQRWRPERSAAYQVVREYLETCLPGAAARGGAGCKCWRGGKPGAGIS